MTYILNFKVLILCNFETFHSKCFLNICLLSSLWLPIYSWFYIRYFLRDFIYLFLERGEGREKGRETLICERDIGCLSHAPNWGPGLQPRHVPWLGTSDPLVPSPHSIHWATRARAGLPFQSTTLDSYISSDVTPEFSTTKSLDEIREKSDYLKDILLVDYTSFQYWVHFWKVTWLDSLTSSS